jgi:putative ABC transport system substrate-binding protein
LDWSSSPSDDWYPPKDLPVENYDKVGLALNLRTARELGLTIPPSIRIRVDTVIE